MSLAIHHLHTRLRCAEGVAPQRLAAWHDAFARQDGDAIAARCAAGDEWVLIRRIPLRLRWQGEVADGDVGRAWGEALEQAIARALAGEDGNCVRYPDRRAALADLLSRAAAGDLARAWAWHRMGLVPREGLRGEEVLHAAVEELVRAPELAWPVIFRLLQAEPASGALTAVLRALPHAQWLRLLEASPRSAGWARMLPAARARERQPAPDAPWDGEIAASAEARALLHWAASHAWFAHRHREIVAALLCACARSAHDLTRDTLLRMLRQALAQLAQLLPGAPGAAAAEGGGGAATARAAAASAGSVPQPRRATPQGRASTPTPDAAPAQRAQADPWQTTGQGGALFWLPQVAACGVLERLEEERDGGQALFLRELALAMGVPADDAVLPAFCGGELPRGDAPPALRAQAEALVAQWEEWLAEAARDLPAPRVPAVCRRAGRLRTEPGWIELRLPLAEVDTAVRRLGLDLDPGWLPWLGCVVRIVYEET